MSGGGTEYRLMWQVRLMVLPALTYTADSPVRDALAAGKKRINWRPLVKTEQRGISNEFKNEYKICHFVLAD